ncbi:hypothetical protein SAMN05421837_118117, partial [Amycolatopsis pretoriensis]
RGSGSYRAAVESIRGGAARVRDSGAESSGEWVRVHSLARMMLLSIGETVLDDGSLRDDLAALLAGDLLERGNAGDTRMLARGLVAELVGADRERRLSTVGEVDEAAAGLSVDAGDALVEGDRPWGDGSSFADSGVVSTEPAAVRDGAGPDPVSQPGAEHESGRVLGDTDIELDSALGVRAVHETNTRTSQAVLAKVKEREFKAEEIRAIEAATSHYAPILGNRRASSSRAHAEQEVRTFGAVTFAVENGRLAAGARAEYLDSHGTVNLYAMGTLNREFGGGERAIEGTVVHELAHGLLDYALGEYTEHVGSWDAEGNPRRRSDGEPPLSLNAMDDASDFETSLKFYLRDPGAFANRSPRRAEFLSQLANEHPDIFVRREHEFTGQAAKRVLEFVKHRQSEFNINTGYWDAEGYPTFDGERPITKYGATNKREDMAEAAKYYFLDREKLRREAPQRAEFFDRLIADWESSKSDAL